MNARTSLVLAASSFLFACGANAGTGQPAGDESVGQGASAESAESPAKTTTKATPIQQIRASNFSRLPAGAIAEIISAGGLHPREFPDSNGVRVFVDGRVESFEGYYDGRETSKVIATLSADRVQAILADTKALAESELVKANPEAPICMDAPGVTYFGTNGEGTTVSLAGRFNCNEFVRKDGAYSRVPAVLDGLDQLAGL